MQNKFGDNKLILFVCKHFFAYERAKHTVTTTDSNISVSPAFAIPLNFLIQSVLLLHTPYRLSLWTFQVSFIGMNTILNILILIHTSSHKKQTLLIWTLRNM